MQEMNTADVTVLGAGIFGLCVAWSCVQHGVRVQIIDSNGVGAGSSGGVVGALAPHTPENWNEKKQFQFDSLIMAEDFWSQIEAVGGQSAGYARSGRLQPINDTRALEMATSRKAGATALWDGKAHWNIIDAHGDWTPQSATGKLIHDTLSARIHPRQACAALAAALLAKGARIMRDGQPSGKIVHATGYQGLLEMAEQLSEPVGNGVKGQALLLDFDARDQPQLFADSLHIIPHADGTVAIGSTSERLWDKPASTDALLEDVHARAVAAFPVLQGAPVIERWAGVRPRAKSRAPMLGHHPYKRGAFVANGGFKIGFGMAPMVGAVMADLILNDVDRIPDSFRVEASLR